MAYKPAHTGMGMQPIAETSAVQKHALGTKCIAVDPVAGEGEFIYLKGAAGTAVGSLALYDTKNGTTTLTVAASRGPAAVAMSANVANQFGWYAVRGNVPVAAAVVGAGVAVAVSAVAGQVNAAAANQMVIGARTTSAIVGGLADAQLMYPSVGDSNL